MQELLFFIFYTMSDEFRFVNSHAGPFGKTDHIGRVCRNLIGGQFPGKPRATPIQYIIIYGPLDNGYTRTLV